MRRKLIKQGNNSYTLTLPIHWIREEGLEESKEIMLTQEDRDLVLKVPKDQKKAENKIEIDLKNFNEMTVKTVLNQAYRKGYDTIILLVHTDHQKKVIDDLTQNTLLGFEVVEKSEQKIILQNIAEPSSEKFEVILRKIFLVILEEGKEILEDFQKGKLDNFAKRKTSKALIDNYANFCRRLIIKEKIGGTKDSYPLMLLVSRLTLINRSYFYLYKYAANQKKAPYISKETLSIFAEANALFRLLYDSFYTRKIEAVHEFWTKKETLIFNRFYQQLEFSKGPENVVLYHLGEIILLTQLTPFWIC